MGIRGDNSIKAQIFAQTDNKGEKLISLCHNSDLESERLDYVIAWVPTLLDVPTIQHHLIKSLTISTYPRGGKY